MNVLFSDSIDQGCYVEFLKEEGAELEDAKGVRVVLNNDDATIWICRDDRLPDEYEEEGLALVKDKLKAVPRSLIIIELSSQLGSSDLAIKFAYALGRKWN